MKRSTMAALFLVAGVSWPARATDWLQFNFNPQHSGFNDQETTLQAGNVATLHLVPGFPVSLGALVSGANAADDAPVFLSGVLTPLGTKDLLFVTTRNGRTMAIDANAGTLVWSQRPSTGPNFTTSSPAIGPGRLFVFAYGLEGMVHKYAVGDGTESTAGGWPELITLKPSVEKESSAIGFATAANTLTYLYVTSGGYPGDAGDYQGHVTAIELLSGTQNVFNASCSDITAHFILGGVEESTDCPNHPRNAIWARPGVVYDSLSDRILMATGNGDFDADSASAPNNDWGDSVFSLNADGTGSGGRPLDSYTPNSQQTLEDDDADLGSTNPVVVPMPAGSLYTHVAAQCGKDGLIRLINLDNMSGAGGPGHLGGELFSMSIPQGGEVLPSPAVWVNPNDHSSWVYVTNSNGISGFEVTLNAGVPQLSERWMQTFVNGNTSPVVAGGVVYYTNSAGVAAFDATTGDLLWHDNNASFGDVHWESPIVVNGRLYFNDDSAQLWAYEPDPPFKFYTVASCRLVDTRGAAGTYGGPALSGGGATRNFPFGSQCGLPADARAVAVNVTVVSPTGNGDLRLYPIGTPPSGSTINFRAGRTRANNTIISLTGNPTGSLTVQSDIFPGSTNLLIDVVGYFR